METKWIWTISLTALGMLATVTNVAFSLLQSDDSTID
jgi:hypothetical protein